jgi:hypothetical protein
MRKVLGLNGREYKISFAKNNVYLDDNKAKSSYHLKARKLLRSIFTSYRIIEEVQLPGTKEVGFSPYLYLDFFVPNLDLAVEVHGEQHYKFIKHFHGTSRGFLESQNRDRRKAQWCELNNIQLIELKHSDSIEKWRDQIENRSREL